jgi:hypothetical protein
VVFAASSQSLEAAAELAGAKGIRVDILGGALEGEAREVARAPSWWHLRDATALNAARFGRNFLSYYPSQEGVPR